VEKLVEYDATYPIHLIAPVPLLIILAENDHSLPANLTIAAFERAREPKTLLSLPCQHTDVYDKEPWLTRSSDAALELFRQYLA
jgi:uncharacterized protein